MVFRIGIINEINVKIIEIIKEMIRELIKIKKTYIKDRLTNKKYA